MRIVERGRWVEVQRDMDFVRDLLLRVEADPEMNGSQYVVFDTSDFPGHTQDEIAYHINLLGEAGFLECGHTSMDDPATPISRLTWDGHEFLAATKDPTIWENVKERTKGLPDVAISVIWELAKAEVKKRLGLP